MAGSYGDVTFRDRNPVKRWLQRRRLRSAIRLLQRYAPGPSAEICDFGGGNGELCRYLAAEGIGSRLVCFEPDPRFLAEARANLQGFPEVELAGSTADLRGRTFDVIFCLEVFEHLPERETAEAIDIIHAVLARGGVVIAGVPVETRLPALYKGLFRLWRRYGAWDAQPRNVLLATIDRPPARPPVAESAPGVRIHYEHMGFDHRAFQRRFSRDFEIVASAASPFETLGANVMPEIYFVARPLPQPVA